MLRGCKSTSSVILLGVFIFCYIVGALSYRRGQLVVSAKRSHFNLQSTQWAPLHWLHSPRFAANSDVELESLNPDDFYSNRAFLLEFSFEEGKFLTPQIPISDGKGKFVNEIEFVFTYSGGSIIDLDYYVHYNDGIHEGKIPQHVYIRYRWKEFYVEDVTLGVIVLLLSGVVLGAGILTFIMIESQKLSTPSALGALPVRKQPVPASRSASIPTSLNPSPLTLSPMEAAAAHDPNAVVAASLSPPPSLVSNVATPPIKAVPAASKPAKAD